MITRMDRPLTFGLIVGTRGIFNPALAAQGRKELLGRLKKLGVECVIPDEKATQAGAIESMRDADICAELFRKNRERIDGVIVVLPNFGDELGVVETLRRSGLDVPVLIQASNDEIDKVDVKSRRDAFCGKLSVCNNLYQYGISFTDTAAHTTDIGGDEFGRDIDDFGRICRVVRGLRSARIAQIGTRPGAFQTVRYSEKLLQATGITVVPVDFSEIMARASALDDAAADVKTKLSEIRSYGRIPDRIAASSVDRQAKLSVAIESWMDEHECQASAVQCWDSVEYNYGCATCLTMSMMGEKLRPSACETDIAGAVSMYALLLASGNPPGFLDWNNNYADAVDKCVCTHCSNYPRSFLGREPEISDLDILGETIGRDRCFGAIKGRVAAGDMTFFRISTDDVRGRIKGYVGEGLFTDDEFGMDGGIAVCSVPRLRKLMATLCANGFEHHVAMTRGRWARIVHEAVTKYLGWTLYWHGEPADRAVSL
jgi:L-fucose isomerase-like protein